MKVVLHFESHKLIFILLMDAQSWLPDWSGYEAEKLRQGGIDTRYFSCDSEWEVQWLEQQLYGRFPQLTAAKIKAAIRYTCSTLRSPREKNDFVMALLKRLQLS